MGCCLNSSASTKAVESSASVHACLLDGAPQASGPSMTKMTIPALTSACTRVKRANKLRRRHARLANPTRKLRGGTRHAHDSQRLSTPRTRSDGQPSAEAGAPSYNASRRGEVVIFFMDDTFGSSDHTQSVALHPPFKKY